MITEKKHPVIDLNYIEGSRKVIFSNGIACLPSELQETFKMSAEQISALMQEWIEYPERYRYDYQYAKSTGILRHYQKKVSTAPAPAEKPIPAEKLQKPTVQRKVSPALIILLVMSIAGIMSACMSAYHTTLAMKLFGRPQAVGLITGIVMVLFSATAFTAARWFWQEKGFVRGFAFIFILLGAMVIAYSMLSTLVVNYNAWTKVSDEQKIETTESSEELSAYETQISMKQEELNEAINVKDRLESEAMWWKNRSWKRYDELSAQLTVQQERIVTLRSELSSLISSKPNVASRVVESKEDVFTQV